jgi:hypothetical protein
MLALAIENRGAFVDKAYLIAFFDQPHYITYVQHFIGEVSSNG